MISFDYITKEDIKEPNLNCPETLEYLYRMLIVGGFGSGKTNALLYLINHEPNIHNIFVYAKDSYEAKNQLLINKRESTGLKYFNDSKVFLEHSNDMDDNYRKFLMNEYQRMNIKVLENATQIKNKKYWLYLAIWLLICVVIKNLIL